MRPPRIRARPQAQKLKSTRALIQTITVHMPEIKKLYDYRNDVLLVVLMTYHIRHINLPLNMFYELYT